MKLTLGQIADWTHAEGVFDTSAEAVGYSIDSRTIGAGELFFAVTGERVDGHEYVEAALSDGAAAAVVSMRWLAPSTMDEAKLLRVPDGEECVLRAMQRLANRVRRAWGGRVIGVTGSAGKTTTKECIAEVLSTKYKVLKTEGNLNNHFGVPLMLLRLEPEHEVAVLEMGMNHAGEITALTKIAEPDWAVVSNVGMAHAEFFSDGIEGIARAKKELVDALPEDGIAFLNGDDERVRAFGKGMGERAVFYGTSEGCDVRATDVEDHGFNGTEFLLGEGGESFRMILRLPGRHNVLNALAALAVGMRSEVSELEAIGALESMRPTEKRGNVLQWNGAEIVNDTYNSNPTALKSMIAALARTEAKRRVLVAGEMLELGAEGVRLHKECGEAVADAGVDVVIGVRGLAMEIVKAARAHGVAAEFMESPEAAGEWLKENLRAGDVVLLKASRGVQLERALAALEL
ncbi:UDP-N-acetylmuramoyl-tripeptide--D-alanyl-D-alanine ligase [Granulicella sp. 5B5]|uniref:UDP-N-acetylmuramoyl-tripeptide--D-alanyl-D- alanine ligase n=1 Tax=Granulicella sp. 5B5 TaxID=1617967 RepID=UPI0015F5ADFB|nr:UDP-N-acetylmuramoyl-tripeptide--D-alanyl-D-alanine ligase [Granulicella sp. 5B5]QMV18125.1 UDP-N-acetylmuramoyl-tripeptide--D-alanyl-D-alanine ligase [Granulicella sp. 5B5]